MQFQGCQVMAIDDGNSMDVKFGQSRIVNPEREGDDGSSKDAKLGHSRISNVTKPETC